MLEYYGEKWRGLVEWGNSTFDGNLLSISMHARTKFWFAPVFKHETHTHNLRLSNQFALRYSKQHPKWPKTVYLRTHQNKKDEQEFSLVVFVCWPKNPVFEMGLLFSPYSISLLLPKNVKLVVFLTLKKLCSFRLFCYSTLHTLVNLTDSISINEMVDWNLLGTFIFLFTMLSLFFKCPLTE